MLIRQRMHASPWGSPSLPGQVRRREAGKRPPRPSRGTCRWQLGRVGVRGQTPCPCLGRRDSRSGRCSFFLPEARLQVSLYPSCRSAGPCCSVLGEACAPSPPLHPGSGLYLPLGESWPSFHQGRHLPTTTDVQHCWGLEGKWNMTPFPL